MVGSSFMATVSKLLDLISIYHQNFDSLVENDTSHERRVACKLSPASFSFLHSAAVSAFENTEVTATPPFPPWKETSRKGKFIAANANLER